MDIETIKRLFGRVDKNYYVSCENCPVDDVSDYCPINCYNDAWNTIKMYLDERYDILNEPTRCEDSVSEDAVNHPSHYNRGKIEVADFIYDQQLNFNRGNAIKYICRAGFKNDVVEDLEKAIWYLNHELKMLRG